MSISSPEQISLEEADSSDSSAELVPPCEYEKCKSDVSNKVVDCASTSLVRPESNQVEDQPEKGRKTPSLLKRQSLDIFFSYYYNWTGKTITTERGIKLVQWASWFISQLAKQIKDDDGHYRQNVSPMFRKLYNDLNTMRYVMRFYGLPGAIEGAISGSYAGGEWQDRRIHSLAKFMAVIMIPYHPLEHLAWVSWNMPKLKFVKKYNGNKLSAWSCRCWFVYIITDWVSSYLKNVELRERRQALISGEKRDDQASTAEKPLNSNAMNVRSSNILKLQSQLDELDRSIDINKLQMIRCALFAGPCYSWSLDNWDTNPWLSENVGNGLCFAEAITCVYQSFCTF